METASRFEVRSMGVRIFLSSWSCAILGVVQAKLRNPSCASGVAQAKVRNPNCAIRLKSCAILVAQPGEVAESNFIQPQGDWT